MRNFIDFHCPNCDRHLRCDGKFSGRNVECPGCGREFRVPTKAEAEKDKFLRNAFKLEDNKYSEWLKTRLKIIQAKERKPQPYDLDAAIPPWLKKSIEGVKKKQQKNPLDGIDLLDMNEPGAK